MTAVEVDKHVDIDPSLFAFQEVQGPVETE
jgi:hypothetical protein